jgi:hypothetical protein
MKPIHINIINLYTYTSIFLMQMVSFNSLAVDETIPHPIDERGLMSQITVKTTRMFRPVEILEIHNGVLSKPELSIAPGTVLVIDNKDKSNHRLVFPPGPENDIVVEFTSTVIMPGQLWGAEFINPGVYNYKCTLHPEKEHGVVRVVQAN